MLELRKVIVFDFDGTLTTKDSLKEFIIFAKGKSKFIFGLIYCAPILLAYICKLYPNWKAKQYLFSYFFKGMRYEEFKTIGRNFSERINDFTRNDIVNKLIEYNKKHQVYIITASIEDWIIPWASKWEGPKVIGTKVEVNIEGKLTGRFLTKNCYGKEKVNRLLEAETNREEYYLIAHGDSNGDKEMEKFADKFYWVK